MRRVMHSWSSHGCSWSICRCSSSSSGTTWVTGTGLWPPSSSPAHALWEGVIILLFFLIFSSIGGVGGRSSFLLFLFETKGKPEAAGTGDPGFRGTELPTTTVPTGGDAIFCVSTGSTGCLRGRPPLAPLARRVAKRFAQRTTGGLSRANAMRSPDVLRYCSASSPRAQASSALIRRPNSSLLSCVTASANVSASRVILNVVFMVLVWFRFGFRLVFVWFLFGLLATKINHRPTLAP